MPLFEVAILSKATKKEVEEGKPSEVLVLGPQAVVAKDAQTAAIGAVMQAKEAVKDLDLNRAEVLVRPFA